MSKKTKISYRQVGDFKIPNIILPPEQANEMYDLLIEQMKEKEGVTEKLKEQDQLEWVQRMDNIQQREREIVCNDLIYV